jgi:hypothetical protein
MISASLARLLVTEGLISDEDGRTIQLNSGTEPWAFAKGVLALGLLDEDELCAILADRTQFKLASRDLLNDYDSQAFRVLDPIIAAQLEVFPLRVNGDGLVCAMADPMDRSITKKIEFFTGYRVKPEIASISSIRYALSNIVQGFSPKPTKFEKFLLLHAGPALKQIQDNRLPNLQRPGRVYGQGAPASGAQTPGIFTSSQADDVYSEIDIGPALQIKRTSINPLERVDALLNATEAASSSSSAAEGESFEISEVLAEDDESFDDLDGLDSFEAEDEGQFEDEPVDLDVDESEPQPESETGAMDALNSGLFDEPAAADAAPVSDGLFDEPAAADAAPVSDGLFDEPAAADAAQIAASEPQPTQESTEVDQTNAEPSFEPADALDSGTSAHELSSLEDQRSDNEAPVSSEPRDDLSSAADQDVFTASSQLEGESSAAQQPPLATPAPKEVPPGELQFASDIKTEVQPHQGHGGTSPPSEDSTQSEPQEPISAANEDILGSLDLNQVDELDGDESISETSSDASQQSDDIEMDSLDDGAHSEDQIKSDTVQYLDGDHSAISEAAADQDSSVSKLSKSTSYILPEGDMGLGDIQYLGGDSSSNTDTPNKEASESEAQQPQEESALDSSLNATESQQKNSGENLSPENDQIIDDQPQLDIDQAPVDHLQEDPPIVDEAETDWMDSNFDPPENVSQQTSTPPRSSASSKPSSSQINIAKLSSAINRVMLTLRMTPDQTKRCQKAAEVLEKSFENFLLMNGKNHQVLAGDSSSKIHPETTLSFGEESVAKIFKADDAEIINIANQLDLDVSSDALLVCGEKVKILAKIPLTLSDNQNLINSMNDLAKRL